MNVKVITDSTSDIPVELARDLDIRVVPIYVRFGEKTYLDGVDVRSEGFYSMLESSPVHPATSQPNPEDFVRVYREYCDSVDGIVSVHISSRVSGTYNSAVMAQKTLNSRCPIEIIDSKFNSGGLGLVVLAAARKAKTGAGLSEVIDETKRAVQEVGMFGMFETMKYLARSGRVNRTIARASQFLNVMPLLTFHDGEIVRAGLVRSVAKGIDRIFDYVRKNIPVSELTIVHSVAPGQAQRLKQRLSEYVREDNISIAELGAGLGVHGGPGVLLAAIRKDRSSS